jgi:hypothetical protein
MMQQEWNSLVQNETQGFVLPCFDIQGDSGRICNNLGNDSVCDSKRKSSHERGSHLERLLRLWYKKDTGHPASTNGSYVINNITTNITCLQVLTSVLLMICIGLNPGLSRPGTTHNKFSKMPPQTSVHFWTCCRVLCALICRHSRELRTFWSLFDTVFHISNKWWFALRITMHVMLVVYHILLHFWAPFNTNMWQQCTQI